MDAIPSSELILNPNGSIYHLHLKSEQLSDTIITVGDPDRVPQISQYFEHIEFDQQKREFRTVTGTYKNKRLTVISTGIGTDNIDIVMNELDALVNIDFASRSIREKHTALRFIRIGTSGTVQSDIPVDSWLMSTHALGLDALLHFYQSESVRELAMELDFRTITQWPDARSIPYIVAADKELLSHLDAPKMIQGVTATNIGFYGPQGRALRIFPLDSTFISQLERFRFRESNIRITNLEMETSGIYGLAKLLGHQAVSLNAILANRATGTFSQNPEKVMEGLIQYTLDCLSTME